MLHRLTLRVLPELNAVVTESGARQRKRVVMFVAGLVAFGLYRFIKAWIGLSDPLILLGVSGGISMLTVVVAYRIGRRASLVAAFHEDGWRQVAWLVGWVGFAYGVQLSLLVLALLQLFVQYNFLEHPDGPAMMAIIIACTSVARDAFEIGCVRRVEQEGRSVTTFPDGRGLWRWILSDLPTATRRVIFAGGMACAASLMLALLGEAGRTALAQTSLMSVVAGSLGFVSFLAGASPSGDWVGGLKQKGWFPSLRFLIWPCWTFAITYYLVQVGFVAFLLHVEVTDGLLLAGIAGSTSVLMTVYGYYLGRQTLLEIQARNGVPENLQHCPFVMSLLGKTRISSLPLT